MRYLFFLMSFVLFLSCKKKVEEDPNPTCDIYHTVSSDTNYIPHKKGNYWNYCNEVSTIGWNGWSAKITFDTIIGNKMYFVRTFNFAAGPSGAGAGSILIGDESFNSMIDSLGNYYFLNYRNNNIGNPKDTILLIEPSATNGDTIYKNAFANIKVVLINKNETFYLISGCYHSRVILNAYSGTPKVVDHYFRKGIGEIYFTENIEKKVGEILTSVIIN